MVTVTRAPMTRRDRALTALGVVATLAVLAVDAALPSGYNVAYLYVITVLISGLSSRTRVVVGTAAGAVGLTILAHFLKGDAHAALSPASIWFSRGVAALVIGLTATVVIIVLEREKENTALGRALRAAERDRETDKRMLAAASEVAAIGTWSITAGEDRFDWSETAAAIHGWDKGVRPTRAEVLAVMPDDDATRLDNAMRLAWEWGYPFREEARIRLHDGPERWIVKMGEAMRGADGAVVRIHGTVQDVTQWKQAEQSATSLSNRFAQLTQALPIIVWTANPAGEIDYINAALARYTGAPVDEYYVHQWMDALDPRDVDSTAASWAQAVKDGTPYEVEYRLRGHDGVYRWHHVAAEPELDEAGAVVRWWGSTINIDATRALKERADSLAAEREMILESMSDGVLSLDPEWRVGYLNASAEGILETPREQLRGLNFWEQYPATVGTDAHAALLAAMNEGVPSRLTFFGGRLGKWLDLSVSKSEGGVTVFFRDITQVRELSEQLAQSQRLEAVGQLTGGIAHDFNNLLTVVWGGADALVSDPHVTGEAKEMALLIASAAERGAELTNRLLAFARRQPLEPRAVDLDAQLRGLTPLIRRTLGEDIRMVVASPEGETVAEVDPGQFQNALLNLTINARDAMPEGGTLTLEVASVTLDTEYITAHAHVAPGTYVVVTVTDSGKGIPHDDQARLFDPFFTTKDLGKGSGLGLSMVWGFVKQSGGHVTVYSEQGYGTSFKMYLPAASDAAVETPAGAPHASPATAHAGTILLAEDDDLVRRFATDRLRAHGFTVVEAASGPEALTALDAIDTLDLLFTDVIMPGGMTGRQLADAVLALRPGTPVLYASGYTENVIVHNGRLDEGVRLLAKPYSTRQLLERVDEALSATEGVAQ